MKYSPESETIAHTCFKESVFLRSKFFISIQINLLSGFIFILCLLGQSESGEILEDIANFKDNLFGGEFNASNFCRFSILYHFYNITRM